MLRPLHFKKLIAFILDGICLNWLMHQFQVLLFSPFIRAINYHDIPRWEADNFERQLQFFAARYSPVAYGDLVELQKGSWKQEKPGLLISFDDGYRSAYEIAAPLLERYGFVGWFFVAPGLIDIPEAAQSIRAAQHRVFSKSLQDGGQRILLTWDQVAELDKKHVIGCHTWSHCRLTSTLSDTQLCQEIIGSKRLLEERLGHDVSSFAWVGGELESYSRRAAEMIRKANYAQAFQTNNSIILPATDHHHLDRTNIESGFSLRLVRFQLSGFMDVLYALKRRRVGLLTRASLSPQ